MAENQRRSILGIGLNPNITLPVPDGAISIRDAKQVAGIYGFVGVTTDGTFFVLETKYISRVISSNQYISQTKMDIKYL